MKLYSYRIFVSNKHKTMKTIIAPSILAADFGQLKKDIEMINESSAEWIHVDVMDGIFVPNISFGFPILSTVKKYSTKVIDVHLMIHQPERFVDQFIEKGADSLSIHFEGNHHLHSLFGYIKQKGIKTGLVLNPQTPVESAIPLLHLCDTLLIMSVNPGFGGQKFIPESIEKVKKAAQIISDLNLHTSIQVDGGVSLNNNIELIKAGANNLVSGSAVFKSENPIQYIQQLAQL